MVLVEFDCHGQGVLEIKCPYKNRHGLYGSKSDKNFPVSSNNELKKNHQYYYQVQHQMLVTQRKYAHFYIWTMGSRQDDKILISVPRDETFCGDLENKLLSVFSNLFCLRF